MAGVLEPSADGYMAIDSVEPETDVNPNAIVFISPGSEPDVRFRVFDDEYHLHSTVLKYHSKFFRQFLDSPDKPAGPASKSFYYEYVSVFDKDGSDWSLQPASKALQRPDAPAGFDFVTESKAFRKYLCALYTRPYVIDHPQELIVMTRMADYYCTLPILSATLTAALFKSPLFVLNSEQELFSDFVGPLIFAARDLHHAELFRECFVLIVSLWTSEERIRGQDFLEKDPQLFTLIQNARIETSARILNLQRDIMLASLDKHFWCDMAALLESLVTNSDFDIPPMQNARFFRKLYDALQNLMPIVSCRADEEGDVELQMAIYEDKLWKSLRYEFEEVMTSKLGFDRSGFGSGEGIQFHII